MSEVAIVGIIPSRYGSTRLPGKALKPILGKPMIQRVHERVSLARGLGCVYVATDDERIARVVEGFGGRAVMTSPNHPSGTDRLAEAVGSLPADIVVNIQGDQPFVDPLMIEELVQPLLDDPSLQMSTLMHALTREESITDPSVVKVVVVGASLDDREEALAGLAAQLFVVGPMALLVTSIAGYLLAGAALRP